MQNAKPKWDLRRRVFDGKSLTVVVGVLVMAVLAVLVLSVWRKSTTPANTDDYEGTIVDRWADYAESSQGSRPRLRLLIESQDGKRFTVNVDSNLYESARIGMRVKSRAGQVTLIDSERSSAGSK